MNWPAVADNCPDAFIHIISNSVNSTVLIVVEVLKEKGIYNPKKLFGVTTLDVVRENTFIDQKKSLKLTDVDFPIIGGHVGITILPLLSKTKTFCYIHWRSTWSHSQDMKRWNRGGWGNLSYICKSFCSNSLNCN